MLDLKIIPPEVSHSGPGLEPAQQLRLVHRAPDEHIHVHRYFCKVVLEQNIVLAVKANVELRIADPADLRFFFLVKSLPEVSTKHAFPLHPFIIPSARLIMTSPVRGTVLTHRRR